MSRYRPIKDTTERALLKLSCWQASDERCYWCDVELAYADVTIDHVVPLGRGGSKRGRNTVIACLACNNGKGSGPYYGKVLNSVKAFFASLYRKTDLIERANVELILQAARERGVLMGRGTVIELLKMPEWPREIKNNEHFSCEKPPRQPVVLEHGYWPAPKRLLGCSADSIDTFTGKPSTDFGMPLGPILQEALGQLV